MTTNFRDTIQLPNLQKVWIPAFAGMTWLGVNVKSFASHSVSRNHFAMHDEKQPAVYILASARNGTIYTGVTSALWNRVATHKDKGVAGFSSKYSTSNLVWYEHHESMESAIRREKQIKKWNRKWKLELIESGNPTWRDLHDEINFIDQAVHSSTESQIFSK